MHATSTQATNNLRWYDDDGKNSIWRSTIRSWWHHDFKGYHEDVSCNEFVLFTFLTDIEVPTLDNVRSAAILGYKISNYNNVICVGPTGTGKTVTITSKLSRGLHKKFICEFIVFSARTSSNQTQVCTDLKLLFLPQTLPRALRWRKILWGNLHGEKIKGVWEIAHQQWLAIAIMRGDLCPAVGDDDEQFVN